MNKFETDYLNLLDDTLTNGVSVENKTRTGTYDVFDASIKVDLTKEPFPILSSREVKIQPSIVEIIGFMRGETNSNWYRERGCYFWTKYGLTEDIYKQVRRDDSELADEYCTNKGQYERQSKEYIERFRTLNELSYEEGRLLIDQQGIKGYKDVLVAKKGDLGPIYGHMWRNWPGKFGVPFDQLRYAFDELKARPYNRRIVITGWNPEFIGDKDKHPTGNVMNGEMSVAPTHVMHEYHTSPIPLYERVELYNKKVTDPAHKISNYDKNVETKLKAANIPEYYLSLFWFQRSWELVVDAPNNIMGYAVMLSMMAKLQNMIPRYLSVHAVHVHVYTNHLQGIKEILLRRDLKMVPRCKPTLTIVKKPEVNFIDQFEPTDITLGNYKHLDAINFPAIL